MSRFSAAPRFRNITPGIERLSRSFSLPRHRHLRAYATIVLEGRFEESGYIGRLVATAGDVLIHPALDCHENAMVSAGVKLIRLEWPDTLEMTGLFHLDAIDEIAHCAEHDLREATRLLECALLTERVDSPGKRNDWPDLLLRDLAEDGSIELRAWAEANGLAPETISRGFCAAYGATPSILRAELRTRAAWLRITRGTDPLSTIAIETGFADQAHMTRWIQRMTGTTPAGWRRAGHALI
jgi:AraC-like DNA-binding protein